MCCQGGGNPEVGLEEWEEWAGGERLVDDESYG